MLFIKWELDLSDNIITNNNNWNRVDNKSKQKHLTGRMLAKLCESHHV